jgi:hypothetical protein
MTVTSRIRPSTGFQDKLPSVYWSDRTNSWHSKIGYNRTANGKRDRAEQRYKEVNTKVGQHRAQQAALACRDQWLQTVNDWPQKQPTMETLDKAIKLNADWSKPVWLNTKIIQTIVEKAVASGMKDQAVLIQAKEDMHILDVEQVQRIVIRNPMAIAKVVNPLGEIRKLSSVSISQAKDLFLSAKREQVGLAAGQGIKPGTYNGYSTMLDCAFTAIDGDMPLANLDRTTLDRFIKHWMALPGEIKARSAVNYCKVFKQFLNWCADQENLNWDMPKGAEKLFRFSGYHKKSVPNYVEALPKIKRLLAASSSRTRLYQLLSLNLGAYQIDIGSIRLDELVSINEEFYIWRQRDKTSHQDGYPVLHWLMPETVKLIKKHMAAIDAIKSSFKRVIKKIRKADKEAGSTQVFTFKFKDFRKIGATAIKRIGDSDTARMYLGQKIQGVLALYAEDDFASVTEALKKWHKELTDLSILPT